ncbi:hypothetical protein Poli38472_000929 [Pythium oligandrum]|uniref:4-nitrophenylphosphatase n=1 Tax=Pythium oligandrum TaxID=41045 RepID=A0A8K1FIL5_PYTOL|nr:hypothetical protein Poli38472_000929 [Pythium oligandrum]|eukprot:TMW60887.1 hypothetical protein Poli38472_000929 [Pythium oligandrum]
MTTQRLTSESFRTWLDGLDAVLFDCDGVLWRGKTAISGAKEAVELLRSLGKRVVFVTNNSTTSRANYVKKLVSMGIPAVAEDIVTSAWATVQYMKKQGIQGKVYMVGETGLDDELRDGGYEPSGLTDGDRRANPIPSGIDQDTQAVVVGLDRDISYYKLAYATACIREIPGCRFIATNPDQTYPLDGAITPGGGCFVQFIEAAVGHPPEAVIGKPSQDLLQTVLSTFNLDPARTCMVGDRLSTDIEFGRRGGLHTLLVLSGITQEHELSKIKEPMQVPDFYIDSVDVLNHFHSEIK